MCVVWCASSNSARERIVASQSSDSFAASRNPRARSMRVNAAVTRLLMRNEGWKLAGIFHPVTAIPSGTRTRPVRRSFSERPLKRSQLS